MNFAVIFVKKVTAKSVFMNRLNSVLGVIVTWLLSVSSLSAMTAPDDTLAFNPADFKIDVSQMQPQGYKARFLSYGYFLALRNDSAFVYLPYMGKVYQPEMNDDGLNFSLPVSDFKVEKRKKNVQLVSFMVKKDFIFYRFLVSVQPNGRVDVHLTPSNAQAISYDGELVEKEKE